MKALNPSVIMAENAPATMFFIAMRVLDSSSMKIVFFLNPTKNPSPVARTRTVIVTNFCLVKVLLISANNTSVFPSIAINANMVALVNTSLVAL